MSRLQSGAEAMRYIVIEGNIGAGKTTLVENLAKDVPARPLLEEFVDNPFLKKFYKDRNRYAFQVEMAFLADRYFQLREQLEPDLFYPVILADYAAFKNLIFARVNLASEDYQLYRKFWDISFRQMRQPDVLIYLHVPVEVLLQRILGRGRDFEKDMEVSYLKDIEKSYLKYLKSITSYPVIALEHINFELSYQLVKEVVSDKNSIKRKGLQWREIK